MLVVSILFWSEIKQINQVMRVASRHHAFCHLPLMDLSNEFNNCIGQVGQADIYPAGTLLSASQNQLTG